MKRSATGQTAAATPVCPFLDLQAQFAAIRDEVQAAVARVFESQGFILGPEVSALEQELRPYTGCEHNVGCASGSDALLLALMALDVGPGDEVIVPPFTFVATAGSVARLGARPVFVDIKAETYNLDPALVANAITPKTKAIIPVHLFGLCADMGPILQLAAARQIAVIEDAAQTIGARYHGKRAGSMGAMGCFSFYPSKNLGGAGDGGMVSTNDSALADKLRVLREHGSRAKYQYELLGMNSRLDAVQAAVLRVKLRHLHAWTEARPRNAQRYCELFGEQGLADTIKLPVAPAGCTHVYNQFTIRVPQREALRAHLQRRGVPTEIYYPHPLHLQPAFAGLGYRPGSLPESEAASAQVVSLPIFPELTAAQQGAIVQAIAEFYRA